MLGTLLGAGGWIVTRVVDEVTSAPILEYRLVANSCAECPDASGITVLVRNLSRSRKLELAFLLSHGDSAKRSKIVLFEANGIPPTYTTEQPPTPFPATSVEFPHGKHLQGLHPGARIELKACYTGETQPQFFIAERSEAVLAKESGILTYLVRHELQVLTAILVIWAITVFWLFTSNRVTNDADP